MGFVRKATREVRRIGRQIDDNIIQPIANTVEAIASDPKKLAMVALSVMAPGAGSALGAAMGLTGTAATLVGQAAINAALNGGDLKSAIISAAIPVVGKEAASLASSAFVDAGFDTALANSAGKVVSGAGLAAATGKDPLQALISGGLNEAVPNITKDIPGFADMPASVKSMINRTVASNLMSSTGADGAPTQSVIQNAMAAGTQAATQGMEAAAKDTLQQSIAKAYAADAARVAANPNAPVSNAPQGALEGMSMLPTADVKSFEQQGFGDIFGGDLFGPANSANKQTATAAQGGSVDELLRILGA